MIFDCNILDGNPADSSLAVEMINRLKIKLGQVPEEVAMDGGLSSDCLLWTLTTIKIPCQFRLLSCSLLSSLA